MGPTTLKSECHILCMTNSRFKAVEVLLTSQEENDIAFTIKFCGYPVLCTYFVLVLTAV